MADRTARRGQDKSRRRRAVWTAVTGLATGVALQTLQAPALAQPSFELVPPADSTLAQRGVSVRAQVDLLYTPPTGGEPVLIQRAFETNSPPSRLSSDSDYIFEVLNAAVLQGVGKALSVGAVTGRVSVVAVCYAYNVDDTGLRSVAPMGVYVNTTDLNVLPDGNAALHTNIQVLPPAPR